MQNNIIMQQIENSTESNAIHEELSQISHINYRKYNNHLSKRSIHHERIILVFCTVNKYILSSDYNVKGVLSSIRVNLRNNKKDFHLSFQDKIRTE